VVLEQVSVCLVRKEKVRTDANAPVAFYVGVVEIPVSARCRGNRRGFDGLGECVRGEPNRKEWGAIQVGVIVYNPHSESCCFDYSNQTFIIIDL
jgi:hypothetical protein